MEAGGQHRARTLPIAQFQERWGGAKVVVFGELFDVGEVMTAPRAGASGYLIKKLSLEALVYSLRMVMIGEVVVPTQFVINMVKESAHLRPNLSVRARDVDLSLRELQVLQYLVTGETNKVIATALGVTEGTVKVHVKRLLKKIDVTNRTQAAIWALNNGTGVEADSRAHISDTPGDPVYCDLL